MLKTIKQQLHQLLRDLYSRYDLTHTVYGRIYTPIYNMNVPLTNTPPLSLYNKYGEPVQLYFYRDKESAHSPYINSRYFQWDRFNFGLDTHFYSHNCMLETMGKPVKRYGMLSESEAIVPNDYTLFERHKELEKDFDRVFTHSAKLLDTLPNARYVPFCSRPWYTVDDSPHGINEYQYKTKNTSMISSDQAMCELHKYRIAIARQCKAQGIADTFGTFDGGGFINYTDTLTDYRFSIAIENDIKPYWFTEKITSCFAAMTIPVYLGATDIGKFFNSDGIITFTTSDDIEKILKKCTKEYYEEHLSAVIDNFNRVKDLNIADLMYKKYLSGEDTITRPEDFFKSGK